MFELTLSKDVGAKKEIEQVMMHDVIVRVIDDGGFKSTNATDASFKSKHIIIGCNKNRLKHTLLTYNINYFK